MNINKAQIRDMLPVWTKGQDRASWFSTNELIELAEKATRHLENEALSDIRKKYDGTFIECFHHLIFVSSITRGKFPKKF